jgi:acylphosphatase
MNASGAENRVRQRVIYHGRVQGVFFRATARELAQGYPVVGYVRNRPEGTVELEAEGPAADVRAFLEDVARRYAESITRREESTAALRDDESGFEVRH